MGSSGRQAIACILLIFGIALYSHAQTNPAKGPTASISGKVTVKGKGVPGIIVVAIGANGGSWHRARNRAITDASGNYRISNLPADTYRVIPHALAFAVDNPQATDPLIIGEGETVEDINFVLVKGGVITGKITDSEGRPLINEYVALTPLDAQQRSVTIQSDQIQSDDRGIYRAFGLPRGKYKVSAGFGYRPPGAPRESFTQTFHPSTTDEDKATVIEVSEGSEISNVDIVVAGRTTVGFKVTGRIIDGDSGKPLPNIVYGLTKIYEGRSSSTSGSRSDADGEFRFEKLSPGEYRVFIDPGPDSEMRANPVSFEVTDRDVTGLILKTVRGASLAGVVVLEGTEKPLTMAPRGVYIHAWVETSDQYDDHHGGTSPGLNPDGTFKINGLRGGTAHINFSATRRDGSSDFGIVRIERDGVIQLNNVIQLKDGEQVSGIRVIVKPFSGAIRGRVNIEDGQLPPSAYMSISVALLEENPPPRSYRRAELDSRGRFSADGLAAGRYEVRVIVYFPNTNQRPIVSKQEVTVSDNTVSEVVVTVKLKPDHK